MSDPVIPSKTKPWPDAPDYFEGNPEGFDIYSWSPAPVGTPLDKAPSTQVHLHGVMAIGRCIWRFKGTGTLDRLIAALIEHRFDVFPDNKIASELMSAARKVRP